MAPNVYKDDAYLQSVIPKRIALFESIKSQQLASRQAVAGDPIMVKLSDDLVKEGKKWETTPFDIAKGISKSLASNALISKVDGVLFDMSRPLEGDCDLKFFTFDDDEGKDTFWHSSAHILGQSLEMSYGCKLCIGPCTTRGEGFYYDAFYGDLGLNEDHFERIDSEVKKAVAEKQPFERIEVSREQAIEMFSDNNFKVEIISDLPEDKTITVYRCGPSVDLCRGPHIPNTSFVKAFACLKASAAYWRGNKDRESLQRVYGISYPDQKRLKEYIQFLEEAKKHDHRELGKKQELFFFHPLSPGSCFFLPHGTRVCKKLFQFMRAEYWKRGYEEVTTPNMFNMQLWEISGHAANYKENMFLFDIEKQEFGLKPMNCPGHCLIFDNRVRSYRDLPLRLADFGVLHRNEASGALTGLTRVRRFQQDDAHIFCRESQIKEEVKGVLEFISYVYDIFGFTFDLKLSTRPEKYLGDLETWDKAEAALAEALNEFGKPWQINEADGAFYGPKIDISVSDAMKRKFQCATLQLDFQLPSRFNLSFSGEDELKWERPVMIHRAILGSVERMFAILLEHYKGKWPFWLSPRQAIVCPVSDKSQAYALEVKEKIHKAGFYVDVDTSDRTIQKKVREAQLAQYNYILVVGEEEIKTKEVSVRVRDKKDSTVMTLPNLLTHFNEEVAPFHQASAAYWRGNKNRESFQRVCGISYPDQEEYIQVLEEAEKYDHIELGKMQELFFFHPLSPGSPFFLPPGTRVRNKLLEFMQAEYWKRGYEEVTTPNMFNMQLWETSGHAANYKENMFLFDIEKQEFGLKAMNCPGHCLIFDNRVRSYRELPLRLADFGVLHCDEASEELSGLTCVRRFEQDDAHIFCRESQIKEEVKGVLEFISYVYDVLGFTFDLKLSTRPAKYLGDLETWDKAEAALSESLNEFGKPWQFNEADGAFYGPKIDIIVYDAMKREHQCATIQLDFQLPIRFNLSYSGEDELKRERPVIIHRAIFGSIEHMFAILLEHYKGKWPFWLSPCQAIVCPVSDKSQAYALEVMKQIHEAGFYVDVDTSNRTIQKKVREAQLAQYNYILVVGEEEIETKMVSVRVRDKKDSIVMTLPNLLTHFKEEDAAFR